MGRRRRDPFEGVELDENFVRRARFVEPSAAERTRQVASAGRPQHSRVLGALGRPLGVRGVVRRVGRRARWHRRRLVRLVALVALLLGIASAGVLILIRHGVTRPGSAGRVAEPGSRPGGGRGTTAATALTVPTTPDFALDPLLDAALRAGMCLTWAPAGGGRTAVRVAACTDPHVDEVTAVLDLRSLHYRVWPGEAALARVAAGKCAGDLRAYGVSSPPAGVPPSGSLVAAAIYPDEPSWKAGAHRLACTVRPADSSTRSGSVRATPTVAAKATARATTAKAPVG